MGLPTPKEAVSIVPDLYYDLIARIFPGTVFSLVLIFSYAPTRHFVFNVHWSQVSVGLATILVPALLGLGYTVGLLMTPFGEITRAFYARFLWKKSLERQPAMIGILHKKFSFLLTKTTQRRECDRCYREMHDYAMCKDAKLRAIVLSKMQAEAAFCSNISSSLFILFIFLSVHHIVDSFRTPPAHGLFHPDLELVVVSVLTCFSSIATFDRFARLLERHFVFLQRFARIEHVANELPNVSTAPVGQEPHGSTALAS